MATTKKAAEVNEVEVENLNTEKTEVFEKETFTSKMKAKAGNGKSWFSRNSKKIKTAVVAGLGVVALGAVATVAKNKLGDESWTDVSDSSTDEGGFTSEN